MGRILLMTKKITSFFIIFLMSSLAAGAYIEREKLKEIYYSLTARSDLEIFTETKSTVLVSGLPSETSVVQIMSVKDTDKAELRILGRRTKKLDSSVSGPKLSFNIEVPRPRLLPGADCDKNPGRYNSCSESDYLQMGELKLKAFKQLGPESYEAISEFSVPVRTKFCISEKKVCGLSKDSELRTYRDQCELEKAEADFQYYGSCD